VIGHLLPPSSAYVNLASPAPGSCPSSTQSSSSAKLPLSICRTRISVAGAREERVVEADGDHHLTLVRFKELPRIGNLLPVVPDVVKARVIRVMGVANQNLAMSAVAPKAEVKSAYWHLPRSLIFGGAGGIGSDAVRHLASNGAKIAVAGIDGTKRDAVVRDFTRCPHARPPADRDQHREWELTSISTSKERLGHCGRCSGAAGRPHHEPGTVHGLKAFSKRAPSIPPRNCDRGGLDGLRSELTDSRSSGDDSGHHVHRNRKARRELVQLGHKISQSLGARALHRWHS
jgi:hypothetical protein